MESPSVPLGEETQNTLACGAEALGYAPEEFHNACELGLWHDFRERREGGILGPPFGSLHIDNQGYPQIRWINVAQNGSRLVVPDEMAARLDPAALPAPLAGAAQDFLDLLALVDYIDSDGIIVTESGWGIEADECYPFTRTPGPEGLPIEIAPLIRDNDGQAVLSYQCHHPAARVDPRYNEREDLRLNHDIDDPDLHDFVVAVLTVEGDTNGDGVVDTRDLTAVAHAGPDQRVECAGPLTEVVLDGTASADPAAAGLTYEWSGSFGTAGGPTPVILLPLGAESITLSIEDVLGRTDVAAVNVTVQDTTAPHLAAGGDVRLEATSAAGAEFSAAPVTASDLCGATNVTFMPELAIHPLGTTVVTITATDGSGNQSVATRRVEVVDTTPPQIVAPPDLVHEATALLSVVPVGQAAATDLFPLEVSSDLPEEGFALGTTAVTWTARDANGNQASAVQQVTIADTTPPQLTLPQDVIVEASAALTPIAIGSATATDLFAVSLANDAPAGGYGLGTTIVTWTATDSHANEAAGSQRVTVVDTTTPALTAPGGITATASGPLSAIAIGEASATDLFEPLTITHDAPAAGFPPGRTLVTWSAEDANGNRSSRTQSVDVTYAFGGIAPPLEDGGIYKASRTLPVKFALQFAGGEVVATAVAHLQVLPLGADDTPGDPLDVQSGSAADGGNTFRYADGSYQYNLSTKGMAPGRYRLVILIDDGTSWSLDLILR